MKKDKKLEKDAIKKAICYNIPLNNFFNKRFVKKEKMQGKRL